MGNNKAVTLVRIACIAGAVLDGLWVVPLERRGVLLRTLVPVKLGLDAASILVVTDFMVPLDRFLLMKIDAALIYALFIAALLAFSPRRRSV